MAASAASAARWANSGPRRHPVPAGSGVWSFGAWMSGIRASVVSVSGTAALPRDAFMPPSGLGRRWPEPRPGRREHCPAVVKQHHAVAQQAPPFLPGMVCHDPGRAATWRQRIRAPWPMRALPFSGSGRLDGSHGRQLSTRSSASGSTRVQGPRRQLPDVVSGELPQHGWMHGVLLAGSIWVNRDRADVPKSGPGRGRRPGSAARAGRPGPRPGRR